MTAPFTGDRDQLDGVLAFLRVAERRSFRAAAADLGISPSAVSQIVKSLEARTGVPLLARTTRRVGLTEAGERFVERARPAVEALLNAFEAARSLGRDVTGLLRLTVPRAVVAPMIQPVIAEFCEAHPSLQVEIDAGDMGTDLHDGGFDAGIRLGELIDPEMVAVRLTPPFAFVVVGAPGYLARHGRPGHPDDLARHRCIRFRRGPSGQLHRWGFTIDGTPVDVPVQGPLIVNDMGLSLAAAEAGLGLAYTGEPLAALPVTTGRLERVLDPFCPTSPGLFLYYPSRTQALPKLQAFADFARRRIAGSMPILPGAPAVAG